MTFTEILRLPLHKIRAHPVRWLFAILLLLTCEFYPSDLKNGYGYTKLGPTSEIVSHTESWVRLTNTVLQIAVPILTRDLTGLKQLVPITVGATVASHGQKRLLNDVVVLETRLGQRPSSPKSKHNMPSGHSTLAASAVVFLWLRYGIIWALLTAPILLLTMYTRVMLDAHTISAVIAGALTGGLSTALFTTRRASKPKTARQADEL
jgi:lipid A 1-phosphatase